MGAGFGADGELVYQTPSHGLPLPPPVPGRVEPTFNGNGQYHLADPLTGKVRGWTRASTVAKTLEDTYMLDAWAKRMMLLGILNDERMLGRIEMAVDDLMDRRGWEWGDKPNTELAREFRTPLNDLADQAQFAAGTKYAAEFGTAVHAWCEYVDHGHALWGVPDLFRLHVQQYLYTLAFAGLRADKAWTERIVLNTRYGIAGQMDRLFVDHAGRWYLGDIKTSKGMDFSWLYFAIQLAVYHSADYVLSEDGRTWLPMPEIDPDTALIALVPSDNAESARIVPMNVKFGLGALDVAMTVREHRTQADKRAQSVFYAIDSEDSAGRRAIMARYLLQTSRTEDEMSAVWESYQDVWTDELTAIGRNSLRSANAHTA